jgi:signal-transduction protein with cAMP-binding, CBS, and nucleotidyltransferase domain
MPLTHTTDSSLRFNEPVLSLLRKKSSTIWTIGPDASVYDAVALMADKRVGALPVVYAGRLAGIISERDYARKIILHGRNSRETKVREIMVDPVLFVTPQKSVEDCMRLMTERRVRHLPVVEGETVTGIISIGDVVNWIMTSQEETIQHLQSYIAGGYPG